jgi:hypothetical protein
MQGVRRSRRSHRPTQKEILLRTYPGALEQIDLSLDRGQTAVGISRDGLGLGAGHGEADRRRIAERAILTLAVGTAATLREDGHFGVVVPGVSACHVLEGQAVRHLVRSSSAGPTRLNPLPSPSEVPCPTGACRSGTPNRSRSPPPTARRRDPSRRQSCSTSDNHGTRCRGRARASRRIRRRSRRRWRRSHRSHGSRRSPCPPRCCHAARSGRGFARRHGSPGAGGAAGTGATRAADLQ